MKNQISARIPKPFRKRLLGACVAAMAAGTPILTAQLTLSFNGGGGASGDVPRTQSGTISIDLSDASTAISRDQGDTLAAPSASGALAGLSGTLKINFIALGTSAEPFNSTDFTGGTDYSGGNTYTSIYASAVTWAGGSDINENVNNFPGQGIVFTLDLSEVVGDTSGLEVSAVRLFNDSGNARFSYLANGASESTPLYGGGGTSGNDVNYDISPTQALANGDQLGLWSVGGGQRRLHGFTLNNVSSVITAPTNLTASTDGAKVDLDWSDDLSGTLDFYTVKRGTDPGGPYPDVVAPMVAVSEFTDTTVATGTTYYYVVTATDNVDPTTTGNSNEVEIAAVIQPPTGLTAVQGDTQIDLDWDDNTSGILASYSVYRSEFPEGPYETPIATGLTTSDYSDMGLTNGIPYYYVVTAIDSVIAGESANSSEVSGTAFVPIDGNELYVNLDGSVAANVTVENGFEVLEWVDTVNGINAVKQDGIVNYPSFSQSASGLDGLDMGAEKNTLLLFDPAAQDQWLDFTDGNGAAPYSGFAIFVAIHAETLLGGNQRDVVLSSVESSFRLGYEAGRPQLLLDGVRLENSSTGAVESEDTVILAVNYDAATGTVEFWDSATGSTGTTTVPAADFSSDANMLLGGSINPTQQMDGLIGEVKIYRGNLTPTEFEDERNALNFKWAGLTPPAGLIATPGDTQVILDWGDQIADSYEVYRDGNLIAENLLTSNYTDTDLTNGVTYEYTLVAIKDSVFSEVSDPVSTTPFSFVMGSSLYYHLDATNADSVTLINTNEVATWADLTGNAEFPATADFGTLLYPSTSLSPTSLAGLDTGDVTKNTLLAFTSAEQDAWLDFTSPSAALPYSGFTVFAVFKADGLLEPSKRDVVFANHGNAGIAPATSGSFIMKYELGVPQVVLNSQVASQGNMVVDVGDTVVLAANYDVETGELEVWDSENNSSTTITVPVGDFSSTQSMFLGGSANGEQSMEGMIGELKIYRGAMTPAEFAAEQTALVTKWIGAPVGGYSGWQNANSTAEGIDGDHDLDGVQNGVEFFLGGTSNTTGFTTVPGLIHDGTRSVTWPPAATYNGTYGTDFVVETSTTLDGPWDPEPETGGNVTFGGLGEVIYTFPSPSGKLFVRLRVTGP